MNRRVPHRLGTKQNPLKVGVVSDPRARKLRAVHISDTHSSHNELKIPAGDILVHSGDFLDYLDNRSLDEDTQLINEFFAKQPHKHKVILVVY